LISIFWLPKYGLYIGLTEKVALDAMRRAMVKVAEADASVPAAMPTLSTSSAVTSTVIYAVYIIDYRHQTGAGDLRQTVCQQSCIKYSKSKSKYQY